MESLPSTLSASPRAHIAASNLGMCQRMLEMSLACANDRITFALIASPPDDQARDRQRCRCTPTPCAAWSTTSAASTTPTLTAQATRRRPPCSCSPSYSTRIVSDGMLRSSAATATSRTPYGPTITERPVPRRPAPCGLEEGVLNVQRITIARNRQKFGGKVEYQL